MFRQTIDENIKTENYAKILFHIFIIIREIKRRIIYEFFRPKNISTILVAFTCKS